MAKSELQTDVASAMVLSHAPLSMEKRANRVTPQLLLCEDLLYNGVNGGSVYTLLSGSVKMGVATFPPVDTAEEINELVEDVPDELVGLEEIELVGAEVVGTGVEVTLGWLFDWAEADWFSFSSFSSFKNIVHSQSPSPVFYRKLMDIVRQHSMEALSSSLSAA